VLAVKTPIAFLLLLALGTCLFWRRRARSGYLPVLAFSAGILLSAIFGATHYFFKPMENWMDALSVGLFGLFWCFTLWRTGTLWFAIGFHAMSDYADMVIFAQPNTGNHGQSLTGHLLNVTYRGPDWLTGGPRGTEASALEFLILAVMFVVFARLYPATERRSNGR